MTPLLSSYSKPDDSGRFAYMMDGERAVAEWRGVLNSEKQKISFQVIITFSSGDIHFVYRDVNDLIRLMDDKIQSDPTACVKTFVKCFLKALLSCFGSIAAWVEPNGRRNSQKTVYET